MFLVIISSYLAHFSRFKQLKEQEARRKKQREEERRKAEEAASKGIQITNGEVKKETSPLESADSELATSGSSSSIDGFAVNGNSVSSEGNDDNRASLDKEDNSETPDDYKNRRDNLHLEKNIEKVPFPVPVFQLFVFAICCKEPYAWTACCIMNQIAFIR